MDNECSMPDGRVLAERLIGHEKLCGERMESIRTQLSQASQDRTATRVEMSNMRTETNAQFSDLRKELSAQAGGIYRRLWWFAGGAFGLAVTVAIAALKIGATP